jgi:hypothetical protein
MGHMFYIGVWYSNKYDIAGFQVPQSTSLSWDKAAAVYSCNPLRTMDFKGDKIRSTRLPSEGK